MKNKLGALLFSIAFSYALTPHADAGQSGDQHEEICDFVKPKPILQAGSYKGYSLRNLPHHWMVESAQIDKDVRLEVKHGGCVDQTCEIWDFTLRGRAKKAHEDLRYWAAFIESKLASLVLKENAAYARKSALKVVGLVSRDKPKGDQYRICQDGSFDPHECSWSTGGSYSFGIEQSKDGLKISAETCESR